MMFKTPAQKSIGKKGKTFEIWTRLRHPKSKGKLIYSDNKFCDQKYIYADNRKYSKYI